MKQRNNVTIQRGVAIYLAVVIMLVLLGIGLGLSTILIGQIRTISGIGNSVTAFYAADTGVEKELYESSPIGTTYSGFLDVDSDGTVYAPTDICPNDLSPGDACYKIEVFESYTFSTVDDSASVGEYSSIAIDSNDLPIVAYRDYGPNLSLKLIECNDPACSGGDEAITVVDDPAVSISGYISIAIDADLLIISYQVAGTLKVAQKTPGVGTGCGGGNPDWTCTTVDDPVNWVGKHTSTTIDANGVPFIAYYDQDAGTLKVAQKTPGVGTGCGGGNPDWTCTVVDNPANDVGEYTSITIDVDGLPIIAYHDKGAGALKVAKCTGDANSDGIFCNVGAQDPINPEWTTITVDTGGIQTVGRYTSIAIGSDDLPVISHYSPSMTSLMVAKQIPGGCAGDPGWTCTIVDNTGTVGSFTSIAIRGTFPIIAYSGNGILKVVACNDHACSGADENFITVDDGGGIETVGEHTSIAVRNDGSFVISYHGMSESTLKVAKSQLIIQSIGIYKRVRRAIEITF